METDPTEHEQSWRIVMVKLSKTDYHIKQQQSTSSNKQRQIDQPKQIRVENWQSKGRRDKG